MRALAVGTCLLVFTQVHTAHADYAETERRLKAAGVDPALRTKIHKAIDRGVEFLIRIQTKRGAFKYNSHEVGVAGLAALALRHAGTPKARTAADKALQFVVGKHGDGHPVVLSRTYEAGITAMLLMAVRKHGMLSRWIARGLVTSQEASGWWGYVVRSASSRLRREHDTNLSTTQFAALGLWAASRQGAPVFAATWRRHLESLVANQAKTGSWSYYPRPYGPGYTNGTMMGAANFALAQEALGDALKRDLAFYRKVLAARLRAVDAVRRDGRAFLAGTRTKAPLDYYGLYALEKACLFLGLSRLGDEHWYREGAVALLKRQNKDGGWGRSGKMPRGGMRSAPLETAFALLFLLRSSESYRPVTPSPVDSPPVVTESAPATPSPKK